MSYAAYTIVMLLGILAVAGTLAINAHAQNNDNIPFHELAQVIVNATMQANATASVTLQSTSLDDMYVGPELARKIASDDRIAYIILTNEYSCVLGIYDQSCIIISVLRDGEWKTIEEIQSGAAEIGNSYIDELNEIFDTRAKFHSVFIHYDKDARMGQASDRRIVSAIYTMPREDTVSMYEKIGGVLLSPEIRRGGGFYDMSLRVLATEGSYMTFSITPIAGSQLMQMRITAEREIADIHSIDPIELLASDSIERSEMFVHGSNPLGSIIQVVVLSDDELRIATSEASILPTRVVDNEQIPLSLSTAGWIFDPISGNVIKGKYLFGLTNSSVEDDDIAFALITTQTDKPTDQTRTFSIPAESLYIVVAILAAAGVGIWLLIRRR